MESKYIVLDYIGVWKDKAVTRKKLQELTGFTDRKVRDCIEELRNEGYFILNDSDGIGYYRIPSEIGSYQDERIDVILKYYWSEWRRAISILKRLKEIRKWLVEQGIDLTPKTKKKKVKDE